MSYLPRAGCLSGRPLVGKSRHHWIVRQWRVPLRYSYPQFPFYTTRSAQKYHKSAKLNRRNLTSRLGRVHDIKLPNWPADNRAVKFHCLSCSVCLLSVLWIFFVHTRMNSMSRLSSLDQMVVCFQFLRGNSLFHRAY